MTESASVVESAPPKPPVRATEERTRAFLAALESKDLAQLENTLHPDATLTIPLAPSGDPEPFGRFEGKEQVLGYFRGVTEIMARIEFADLRVSVTADAATSFVQAKGNFTTPDDRPYPNVYVLRADWSDGKLIAVEEYANPVTFAKHFGVPIG
ncbi:nuclear transport factor 2 family protein [Streptomonospora nanhaiensis]|uniref:nuclear transport factor 2 family protein n=1 Tax=Streptomonospora nanhaiensis TaxID=1323731 RepID=UPI001C9917DB|nr:nuclear transport factor 2 family protein [Streptomonospora nanhaiensis]MBX9387856.1 nuclear transport factor 2 family protein [Streptomonospora nanhaiensis]